MTPLNSDNDSPLLPFHLLNAIHSSIQFGYVVLADNLNIISVSPNLHTILQVPNLDGFLNLPLTHLFGEFVGAEERLTAVKSGQIPFYRLENIAHSAPDGTFFYFTLQIMLFDPRNSKSGFWISVENSTTVGQLQQRLTQQRNELKQEVLRRKSAEEKLQQLNDQLEQRVYERTIELARANEQLKLLEAAIVNTNDTVIITEFEPTDMAQAGIVYVNQAFTRATGYTYKEVLGQSRRIFQGPNTDPNQLENIRESLLKRESVHVEVINYRKDGSEFWADMTIAPIVNEKNELTHFVSIERDTTKRKQLEAELLQAKKMEAIGLLAGGIAHDFNNILTVIISYSDLLLRYFPENEKVKRLVAPISTAGKRASNLIYQLLAFSRQQMLRIEKFNLNDIVLEVENMIKQPIGEDIQLTTKLADDLWSVEADPGQLNQVIMNLAINARDAMPQGGILLIETENNVLDQDNGRIKPKIAPGQYVKLTVSDNGTGMSHDELSRIFEPFFTTKEMGKGTGLGLSTVYGIVAQSQGGITVQSSLEAGTKFEIYLPRAEQKSKEVLTVPSVDEETQSQNATILLVEDDKNIRQLIQNEFTNTKYKILVAENGKEALNVSKTFDGPIDLIVTDVVMPHMGGYQLAQELQKGSPSIKVLYITGYTDTVIANHGIVDNNENILQKPFTLDQLMTKIENVLNSAD
jgi:PAS domain S-box-containing protein